MGRAPGPESGSFHSPLHHLTSTYTIRYIYSILTVICAAAPNREHQRAPARATLRYISGAERRRKPPRCSPLARRPAGPAARRAGTGRALRHGEHRGWRRFAAGRPAGRRWRDTAPHHHSPQHRWPNFCHALRCQHFAHHTPNTTPNFASHPPLPCLFDTCL